MKSRFERLGALAQGIGLGLLLLIAIAVMLGQGAGSAVFRYQGF